MLASFVVIDYETVYVTLSILNTRVSFYWLITGVSFYWKFFSSIIEINRLITKGVSNIYYWEKLTFSKLSFYLEKKMKKWISFGEQKGRIYIRGNVYLGIIVFSCLSSTKPCLRFLLICFVREVKAFYQSSLGNKVDFTDIMNVTQISRLKIKIPKNWDTVL